MGEGGTDVDLEGKMNFRLRKIKVNDFLDVNSKSKVFKVFLT